MKTFYDYIYYRICRWGMGKATKRVKPGGYWQTTLTGVLVSSNLVSVCIAVYKNIVRLFGIDENNLGGFIDFVRLLLPWRWSIDETTPDGAVAGAVIVLGGIVAFLAVMVIYAWRFDISPKAPARWKGLCKKWDNEPERQRRWRGWGIMLFFALSLVLCNYCLTRLEI